MISSLEDARKELGYALEQLESAKVKTSAAQAALDTAQEVERGAHALVASTRQRVVDLEREPSARADLEARMTHLKSRIATFEYPGDEKSPTRAKVERELAQLEADERSSNVSKVEKVKGLADAFAGRYLRDRQGFDAAEGRNHAQRLNG